MTRRLLFVAFGLIVWQFACGGGTISPTSGRPANISVSPGGAAVGSPDLTLMIAGSNTFAFAKGGVHYSTVVWSQNGVDTSLMTTFVSSSACEVVRRSRESAEREVVRINTERPWLVEAIDGSTISTYWLSRL